jgi:hypothetical protein
VSSDDPECQNIHFHFAFMESFHRLEVNGSEKIEIVDRMPALVADLYICYASPYFSVFSVFLLRLYRSGIYKVRQ